MIKHFYEVKVTNDSNINELGLVEKILMGVVFTSIVWGIGFANSAISSEKKYKHFNDESLNSKTIIKDLKSNIDINIDKIAQYDKYNSSLEYKSQLIKKKSGITISKNLPEKYLDLMMATADYYRIPYKIYFRLGAKESYNFSSTKSSPKGAKYYFQIMPGTFKQYAKNFPVKTHNIETNIMVSGLILTDMYKYYGDWTKAVAAYNAGPNAVDKYNGVPNYPETIAYVKFVMSDNFNNE